MRLVLTALSVVAATLANLPTHARGPYGSIKIGNWIGGAYTNDQTGAFTHCAAGALYKSGIYLMVMIDQSGEGGLGVANQSWKLNAQAFPIALTFDGQTPFHVHGVPIADNLVGFPCPRTPR